MLGMKLNGLFPMEGIKMEWIKRYIPLNSDFGAYMNECHDGHCVMYTDYLKAVEELKKELSEEVAASQCLADEIGSLTSELAQEKAKNQRLVWAVTGLILANEHRESFIRMDRIVPEIAKEVWDEVKLALKDNEEMK